MQSPLYILQLLFSLKALALTVLKKKQQNKYFYCILEITGSTPKKGRVATSQVLHFLAEKHSDSMKVKQRRLDLKAKKLELEEERIRLEREKWDFMIN